MSAGTVASGTRSRSRALGVALVPLALLAAAVAVMLAFGDRVTGLVGQAPPSPDAVAFERVRFEEDAIVLRLRNPQQSALTIAVVTVDDAIVPFTVDGPATLGRLRATTVRVPYPWLDGEPYAIGVTTSSGIQSTHEVAAAYPARGPSPGGFLGYALIGVLVGVVPVALGMLWLPALRRARPRTLNGFLAFTAGLLGFLAVEALSESLELQARVPAALKGPGLVLVGIAASTLGLAWVAHHLAARGGGLATLVATGIGLHNLGEGLAIGASFALGEVALGTALIIGFMVHNVTEGLGIAAPVAAGRERASVGKLALLVAIAGVPAVLGAWLGAYLTNDLLGVAFFALAAGAALQVVWEIGRRLVPAVREDPTLRGPVLGGLVLGVIAMYATGVAIG